MDSTVQNVAAPAARHMLATERRAVAGISGIAVLRMFGLFMLLPVLALWAGELDGATPLLIGIAVSGYGVTQALLQIPAGALSDRIGRRPVLVAGLLLFTGGSIVAALAGSIGWLVVGRLLQGAGAISSTLTALLADTTRDDVRLRATAVFGISIGLSFVLSLIAGPLLGELVGVSAMFWMAAALGIVALGLLSVIPSAPVLRGDALRELPAASVLAWPLVRLDLAVFVLHALLTALFVMLPYALRDAAGLGAGEQSSFYLGAILASLLLAVPLILLGERRRRGMQFAGVAYTLIAAGCLAIALGGGSLAWLFAGMVLFFGGFNFLEAGLPAWISLAAGRARRGLALGMFSSAQFLGAFAGGVLGGLLLEPAAAAWRWYVLVAIAVAAGLALRVPARDS